MNNKLKFILLLSIFFTVSFNLFSQGYKAGDIASDFLLKNIDGKNVSLSQFENAKGFIVVFSCNHCPYVKKYEGRIDELNKQYSGLGYPVVAINSNDADNYPEDNFQNMQKNAKEKNFSYPYLHDESQEVAKKYGALKTPHVYVLEKTAKGLVVKYIGAVDDNVEDGSKAQKKYVEDAVNALLEKNTVKIKETKAIGCGIKWKE